MRYVDKFESYTRVRVLLLRLGLPRAVRQSGPVFGWECFLGYTDLFTIWVDGFLGGRK